MNDKKQDSDNNERRNMTSKIFISYSRKDLDVVTKLRDEIHSRTGVEPWMDITGIETGAQFADVIAKNIEGCELLVFVVSCNSVESSWTRKEVLYALNHGKKIYPVVIDDVQLPRELDLLFADVDRVDVRDCVQREKLFSDIVSFCAPHGFGDKTRAGGSGDAMLAKQSTCSSVDRTVSAGTRRTFTFRACAVCAIFVFVCILVWINWCGRSPHRTGPGLVIENGRILTGKEVGKVKRHQEQTARVWENSTKICNELNLETISLRRKLRPFVQTGALAANDAAWISACKRADEYLNWVFEHGKTPEAQIKERTAIRDGFLELLERLKGELQQHLESATDESMAGGTFVRRTISRAALELAFLSEDDRAAAIVDFHRSIRRTSREWYANDSNLAHDEIIDRIGREYDIAVTEGNKLFNAGMHRTDEISKSRPDLVMQFYDIRHRVLNDINVLVGQGQTEKALLYYSSATKAFEVLHLEALKRPDFTSVKVVE